MPAQRALSSFLLSTISFFSRVSGASPPKPVSSFGHFGFDDALIKAIRRSEFAQPTPIQSQAIPALSSGRDCIGIAKTGSGKTAAFLWPMLGKSSLTCRTFKRQGCWNWVVGGQLPPSPFDENSSSNTPERDLFQKIHV